MMCGKRLMITMMLGIAFCFGAIAQAVEKPTAAQPVVTEKKAPASATESSVDPKTTVPSVSEAPTPIADNAAPEAFVPQKHFAFPSTMDGTKVVHDFIIQNKGDAPLKITKVKTG